MRAVKKNGVQYKASMSEKKLRSSLGTALQGITGHATGTVSLLPQPPSDSKAGTVVPVIILLLIAWMAVIMTQ